MRRRQKTTALVVAAVSAVGGTLWIATTSGADTASDSAPATTTTSAAPTTAVAVVQSDIQASFVLFRDRPPSPMPPDVAVQVGSPAAFGRNPDLARAIKTATGTGWVIPGDGYLCIAVPDPVDGYGTTCATTADAVRHGLAITLWGDIPGAAAADTVLVADGQRVVNGTAAAPLDDGVASALTDAPGTLRPA